MLYFRLYFSTCKTWNEAQALRDEYFPFEKVYIHWARSTCIGYTRRPVVHRRWDWIWSTGMIDVWRVFGCWQFSFLFSTSPTMPSASGNAIGHAECQRNRHFAATYISSTSNAFFSLTRLPCPCAQGWPCFLVSLQSKSNLDAYA